MDPGKCGASLGVRPRSLPSRPRDDPLLQPDRQHREHPIIAYAGGNELDGDSSRMLVVFDGFDYASGFETNIRSLLELRFEQIVTPSTDTDLRDFVRSAVRDIGDNPALAIKDVRGIAERALSIIWKAELPPDRRIPSAWIDE